MMNVVTDVFGKEIASLKTLLDSCHCKLYGVLHQGGVYWRSFGSLLSKPNCRYNTDSIDWLLFQFLGYI